MSGQKSACAGSGCGLGSSLPTMSGKGASAGLAVHAGHGEVPAGREQPVLPVLPHAGLGTWKSPELQSRLRAHPASLSATASPGGLVQVTWFGHPSALPWLVLMAQLQSFGSRDSVLGKAPREPGPGWE